MIIRSGLSRTLPIEQSALSVSVPADFAGMQLYSAAAYPEGAFLGNARPWAYYGGAVGCNWSSIETSKGTFDWTDFDAGFSKAAGAGSIYFTLGRTPAWAGPGINLPPTDLADWSDMCAAFATRAKNTHGRVGVYWDIWNEVDYNVSYNGTATALAQMARAASIAIKAVDPAARILSPSIIYTTSARLPYLTNALTASDGAGGTMLDWVDGIGMHYYAQDLANEWYSTAGQLAGIKRFKAALLAAGADSLPIHINEGGIDRVTKVYSAADQHLLQLRAMALCASEGIHAFCVYVADGESIAHFGNVAEFVSEWNAFAAAVSGKIITRRTINPDQSVTLVVDGVKFTW